MKTTIDKIKMLGTQMYKNGTPLVSIFIPLKSNYMPAQTIFNSLIKTANKILVRDGYEAIKITQPDWIFWQSEGTQSLGLYHAEGVTTIIPLNVLMEPRVIVANSFHVKPIIASTGNSGEALLLTFHKRGCSLTRVTSSSSMLLETYIPSSYDLNDRWLEQLSRTHLRDFIEYMKSEINSLKSKQTRFLMIDGVTQDVLKRSDLWAKLKLPLQILEREAIAADHERGVDLAKKALKEHERQSIKIKISEALALNPKIQQRTEQIEDIAKLILQRKITKIFLSLEDLVFGELNTSNGEVSVHRGQKNSQDDDLLDDLAELALKNGIVVHVVPNEFFPEDHKILYA